MDWSDGRLVDAVRGESTLAMKATAVPTFSEVIRWPRAIPQYHVGHLDRLARIDARLACHAGLYLGGNAYRGVAMNDCTEDADRLAERIAGLRMD